MLVTACANTQNTTAGPDEGIFKELPESILTIAAPDQDLTAVKIDETDGCYVYRHRGPVETIFLPLRTKTGNPICSRAAKEAATG
ncbi:hypothetical protein GGR95_001571 [Sulfitobacter undariae]|uniref:Uncharacterized protein n=1 Tax=Sulfitobacter undariae TaxID=1563671 RepID=A0A7W6E393_9RHOB|nr:hypothetical protein [Sulfitobacter undariae]MBB3993940.1 hypothetical protein [Sulfitobacter undariae]